MSPFQRSRRRIAATVAGETATQACRRYTSRAADPSRNRPALAIHHGKCTPNWALCTWWTTQSTGTFDGRTSGVKNGIPFFTPLVLPSKVPVLCVVHHVHSAQFGVHFPWWMASAGRFLEGSAARLVYRRHACVAVSPATVAAMRRRLRWKGDIYLIPNGVPKAEKVRSFLRVPNFPNTSTRNPRNLVWVGRLVAHKRAELLLPLAERLRLRLRNDRLVIDVVGRGPAEGALAAKVAAYSLERTVRLRGFLPEADKQALVAGSLLHLNTSQGEGWGLCVLEAAACGVPTVAYDVEGLRDAVRDGQTGWLVRDGETLADVVDPALKELATPARRATIAPACRQWAAQFDWAP